MKKQFNLPIIFVAFTLLCNSSLKAQTGASCINAISIQNIINLEDTGIVINHSINYYNFQNDSAFITLDFYKSLNLPNLGKIYNIQILKGNCANNVLIFDTTVVHGTNNMIFELANQTSDNIIIRIENIDTINCPVCSTPYNLGLSIKNASYSNITWPAIPSMFCPNIVANPSFEDTTGTITCQGIAGFLNNWIQVNHTPDWLTFNNSCTNTNIPNSTWFGTIANPPISNITSPNNAYVGVVTALFQNGGWDANVKEKLRQDIPILTNSKEYLVRAKVALAPGTQYTSNNMNIRVSSPGNSQLGTPQLSSPMLTTPNVWIQLENTFVSNGTENRIIIGNNTNSTGGNMNTTVLEINPSSNRPYAYYFADDIELYRLADAGPDVTISHCTPAQIGSCMIPGAAYLWTPSIGLSASTDAQPSVMPTQTTQYIVQVIYQLINGNTAIDYDTVTVTVPPCNCFANAGPDITILDCTPMLIGPDCINPNLSYSWSPSAGLSDPNAANPLALPVLNTSYILTVTYTDQFGYTFIDYDTINVNINTQACISAILPNTINTSIYANNLGNALNTNTIYAIDGTVFVNIPNFTISNIDLVCGPNTKFVIFPNCQLNIINSYLHGCCAMWHGIKVNQNGTVNISGNSVIEDADTAITIRSNGVYLLSNSIFNKNYVDVAAIGTPLINQIANISNCTFDCNDSQMPSTFSTFGLRPPMLGLRSAIALSALSVNPLFIGTTNSNGNEFYNHDFGLFIINTNLTAKFNNFKNIDDNSINTYNFSTPKGINIHLENNNFGNYNSEITDNTFLNGVIAISAFKGYNGKYLNNIITDMMNFGIVFSENNKRDFRIFLNTIDNVGWVGIYSLNNYESVIGIHGNTINNSYNKLFRTGIGVDELIPSSSSMPAYSIQINRNTINNYQYGITTTRLRGPRIMSNNINIQPTPWGLYSHGIRLFENYRADIIGNTIFGNNRDEYFVDGIRNDQGTQAKILCNYTVKTGSGAFFAGSAIANAQLHSNIFLKDFWGVVLANQAKIGGQGFPANNESFANQWIGSMGNPDYAHTFAYYADGSQSPFFTLTGYPWQPTINTNSGGSSLPINWGAVGNNQFDNCSLYRDSIDTTVVIISPINEPINETQLLQQINTAESSSYTASQAWWIKASAYNRLEAQEPSAIQNFDLVMFKDSVDSAALGKLNTINKMLSDTIVEDIDSLRAANSAVGTNSNVEQLLKMINEINMLRIKNGKLDYEELVELRNIAAMCPFEEGPAVYTARALLRGIDYQRQEYMHECEKVYPTSSSNRESESQALNNIANDEVDFGINPNPAKSVITLTQKGDFKLIQISEMSGKIVFESVLNTNENSHTFELSHLSNGIYMITLVSDFKTVRTKLIINK
ncbi:MAG TPA: T9SS type A sorting domain-containing protein [Bacteroidia bacterium]|nr:T9SS type A sorting domain-containing protein [Bacteroidia bacterium]